MTGYFERTRENILHIFRALGVQRSIKSKEGKCSLISERIFNLVLFPKKNPKSLFESRTFAKLLVPPCFPVDCKHFFDEIK